jgi:hypothetical protein
MIPSIQYIPITHRFIRITAYLINSFPFYFLYFLLFLCGGGPFFWSLFWVLPLFLLGLTGLLPGLLPGALPGALPGVFWAGLFPLFLGGLLPRP